jgi:hypothetical protein
MKRVEFVLVIFRQVEACDEGLALEPCSKSEGGTFITADVASSWRPSVVLWPTQRLCFPSRNSTKSA